MVIVAGNLKYNDYDDDDDADAQLTSMRAPIALCLHLKCI